MIEITRVPREGITVTGSIDTPPAQLLCFCICQVPFISLVEDTVGECAAGTDREKIALEAGAIGVYVKYSRALLRYKHVVR